jgi:acetyl-CoA carboxylase carboxyl transferase subunit alpha
MLDFEQELLELRDRIAELNREADADPNSAVARELAMLQLELEARTADVFSRLSAWQRVHLARHPKRPHMFDFVERIFTDFTELHGDRQFADDGAVVGGMARLDGDPVMLVGHQKGRTTNENVERNFGMAHPEGYRKARRLFAMAEKFQMPVATFLDTPGASPLLEDEERGQSWAIAESMASLVKLRVPIVVTVIGEGGSGGALAIGVGDRILMLEHAIYSVASPEAAASIIWRDADFAEEAAASLRLTSDELLAMGLIDQVVAEPMGGAHNDHDAAAVALDTALRAALAELGGLGAEELVDARYAKFSAMTAYEQVDAGADA